MFFRPRSLRRPWSNWDRATASASFRLRTTVRALPPPWVPSRPACASLPAAASAPASPEQLQVVGPFLSRPITPVLAPPDVVLAAINEAYHQRTGQAQAFIERLDRTEVLDEVRRMGAREDLLDNASRAPVIKLVN